MRKLCGVIDHGSQCVLERDHHYEHCDPQGREWWNDLPVKKWLQETEGYVRVEL